MFLSDANSYLKDLFVKSNIDTNNAYFCYETAVRYWFPLKHPYDIITVLNQKINYTKKFDNISIVLLKSDNIDMSKATKEDDGYFYQSPIFLVKEYIENKDLFLSHCHTKDEVEEMMEIKSQFFKEIGLLNCI